MLEALRKISIHLNIARKQKSPGSTGEQGLLGDLLTRLETVENLILADQAGSADKKVINRTKPLETLASTSFQPTCLLLEQPPVGSSVGHIVGRF